MMRFLYLTGAALLGLGLAACSPQSGTETQVPAQVAQDVHPISGLEVIPLSVNGPSGTHDFRAEVAASAQEQSKGLMFRTEIGPGEAMIFPRTDQAQAGFWMKNVPIPLDIIFIGLDGRISNIAAMTVPYSTESVYSVGPVSGILELRGGRAAELGIVAGDKVAW